MSKFNDVTAVIAYHIFTTGVEAGLLEDNVCDFASANVFAAAALEGLWQFLGLDKINDPDKQEAHHV